jgi:N-acetylglutamate synthase-like GNAT family acetyltransferase
VVGEGHHDCDHPRQEVILRDATSDDEPALESFDLGDIRSPWLDEVAEIVSGLVGWREDVEQTPFDRRVVVADDEGEIVAVAAHHRVEHERLGPLAEHRYLMVVAVRADQQLSGIARVLTESLLAEMQRNGVRTVGWLVHPANFGSIAFSRSVFAEADETYPPEDRPYARFVLDL